jgi:hypothetical protein
MPRLRLAIALAFAAFAVASPAAQGQSGCVRSWSPGEYKSFGQVQAEVLSRFAGGRIISVRLCGQGGSAYIVVMVDTGREIKTVTIGAK